MLIPPQFRWPIGPEHPGSATISHLWTSPRMFLDLCWFCAVVLPHPINPHWLSLSLTPPMQYLALSPLDPNPQTTLSCPIYNPAPSAHPCSCPQTYIGSCTSINQPLDFQTRARPFIARQPRSICCPRPDCASAFGTWS